MITVASISNYDKITMKITSAQLRMARAALAITVRELGELAGVHFNTITRLESGEPIKGHAVSAVQQALERAGVEFVDPIPDVRGPGVALKLGIDPLRKSPHESISTTDIDDSTLEAWPRLSPLARHVITTNYQIQDEPS